MQFARAIRVTLVGVVMVGELSGFEFELARSRTSKSPVVIVAGQVRVAMHLDFPARCPIGRECRPVGIDMDSAWSFVPQQPTNKAIPPTEEARKCRCIGLRGDARPGAGRTCPLHFDTIELGNMIVCGLPASPHDSVHVSDARRRLLRVPR